MKFTYILINFGLPALFSRVFVLLLSKIIFHIFERFDKSASLANEYSFFNNLLSWDAIHFLSITKNYYTKEHQLCFFPLLPLITRFSTILFNFIAKNSILILSFILIKLFSKNYISVFNFLLLIYLKFYDYLYLNIKFSFLTVGILLNNLFFILSAMILAKISFIIYKDLKITKFIVFSFIFNPIGIIYSSFYTESLFCLLFFISFYFLIRNKKLEASIVFGISTLCRSNSLLNIIFLNYKYFIVVILPISLFQLYSLSLIWKFNCFFKILIPYSYCQKKYWNQGFLKFFKLQNLPNFLVGAPFIFFSLAILKNYKYNKKNLLFNKLYLLLLLKTITLIFFIHWNIALRFISYNPLIYFKVGEYIKYKKKIGKYQSKKLFNFFLIFNINFFIIYIILFSAFYPPC